MARWLVAVLPLVWITVKHNMCGFFDWRRSCTWWEFNRDTFGLNLFSWYRTKLFWRIWYSHSQFLADCENAKNRIVWKFPLLKSHSSIIDPKLSLGINFHKRWRCSIFIMSFKEIKLSETEKNTHKIYVFWSLCRMKDNKPFVACYNITNKYVKC